MRLHIPPRKGPQARISHAYFKMLLAHANFILQLTDNKASLCHNTSDSEIGLTSLSLDMGMEGKYCFAPLCYDLLCAKWCHNIRLQFQPSLLYADIFIDDSDSVSSIVRLSE